MAAKRPAALFIYTSIPMSDEGLLILAVLEAVCLAVLGTGAVVLMRRSKASRESLWTLARRDALTGVGNYRALHERLAEEIARHARHRREFALIAPETNGEEAEDVAARIRHRLGRCGHEGAGGLRRHRLRHLPRRRPLRRGAAAACRR